MEGKLAELLLAPATGPDADFAGVRSHLEACEGCRRELAELRATMALLDEWEAPEPNPYFLTRLGARIEDERAAEPAGWLRGGLARMRARLVYGAGTHVRPLAAMALTVVLLVGGGAYLDVTNLDLSKLGQPQAPAVAGQAAVVHDLQTMDNNAQLLDQLEALSSTSQNGD